VTADKKCDVERHFMTMHKGDLSKYPDNSEMWRNKVRIWNNIWLHDASDSCAEVCYIVCYTLYILFDCSLHMPLALCFRSIWMYLLSNMNFELWELPLAYALWIANLYTSLKHIVLTLYWTSQLNGYYATLCTAGPRFRSQFRDLPSWLRFSWFSWVPPGRCQGSTQNYEDGCLLRCFTL
jgi:hypothetical protein